MRGWQRTTAGVLIALVGVAFIGSVIVNELFSVGPAFERMSDGFRPVMASEHVDALKQDLAGMSAVGEEFTTTAVPTISGALGVTPEAFTASMATDFPDVAAGLEALPGVVTSFEGVVGTLEAEQERFADADAIPTSSLPTITVPWGLVIAGAILLLLGIWVVVGAGRGAALAAVIVGALLVVVPVLLSLPTKAASADTMNENLEPVYTQEMIGGGGQALAVFGAMGTQMQEEMLPALGAQLGMDEAGLNAFLQENLPAMAGALAAMPDAMGRFTLTVETFQAHLDDYETLKPVAFTPIVWTMIVGGVVALLAGAWGVLAGRKASAGA